MISRIIDWFNLEPTVSVLMLTTAIVLFGSAFVAYKETSGNFWPWIRRVIEATVGAALFIGLLWAFRAILNDNVNTFFSTHGSLSDISRNSAWSIWGRPHTQADLTVIHTHDVEMREELPREDLTQPPLYRNVTQKLEVPQNSITAFDGVINMELSEREKGYALYSGYILNATLNYTVKNQVDFETDTVFRFPLSPKQTLFENFIVKMDGDDITSDLQFNTDIISWSTKMKPQQISEISISYVSRGMDYFYYQIPLQREIKNFKLTLTIDRLPVSLLNYPDGVITPTNIKPTEDGRGSVLTWELDNAITVAGMGVALLQPEQPGAKVLRVLLISPYALTLLAAMLALTMLIWGMQTRFIDIALVSAVYTMQFLLMAAVSDYFFGFWGAMILGAGLTLLLSFLLFRKLPARNLRITIYGLVAFFTIIYPLSGLLTDLMQQNSFNLLVQVGLIAYITILYLYVRDKKLSESEAQQ